VAYIPVILFLLIPVLSFVTGIILLLKRVESKSKDKIKTLLICSGVLNLFFVSFFFFLGFSRSQITAVLFVIGLLLSIIQIMGSVAINKVKEVKKSLRICLGIASILLLVIGSFLIYDEFFASHGGMLPERCNIEPEFICEDYQVTASDGYMKMVFTPRIKKPVQDLKVINVSWAMESVNASKCSDLSGSYESGDMIELTCGFNESMFPPLGAKMKFVIKMTYIPLGKNYSKPLTAEIYLPLME